jgi:acetolactate synthase I/II/III large subunit
MGVMNAARSQIPMLFTAGRTPLFEEGRHGSRNAEIHWAQEMFDQAGMMRELVKWDYELRDGLNVEGIVDRALGITHSHPRAPVYLTLPREVLAQKLDGLAVAGQGNAVPAEPYPDPQAVRRVAEALVRADCPVISCTASGLDTETIGMLVTLADRFGIGVLESKARYLNFPSSHPLHLGHNVEGALADIDAMLILESDVPWLPRKVKPRADAFIAQAGVDPLFSRYPVRSFPAAVSITTTTRALIPALIEALQAIGADSDAAARRARMVARAAAYRKAIIARREEEATRTGPINKAYLSDCLNRLRPSDSILVNEYSAQRDLIDFEQPGTYFVNSPAAGLGWGLPAALGAQQAAPDRVVIAVIGDGAYIFANPAACHHAAAMHKLPVLMVVFNNARWGAVHMAAGGMYPQGEALKHASQHGTAPLSSLQPIPDFEKYAEASGGWGIKVSERAELMPALQQALQVVRTERRHALVNVIGI